MSGQMSAPGRTALDPTETTMNPSGSSPRTVSRKNPDSTTPATDPADNETSGPSTRDAKGKKKAVDNHDTWLNRNFARFGSLNLENKGSVARDHLALERTFLAWLRTSLSFASIGIAVTQLFRLNAAIGNSDPASEKGTHPTVFSIHPFHCRTTGRSVDALFSIFCVDKNLEAYTRRPHGKKQNQVR
ncbi:hypothetical protein AA313_de0204329 [Arthrobotrys entomopaga]|nr:hypothetical protein AA313_de0204329 [Arthrobotrys entomopaga]